MLAMMIGSRSSAIISGSRAGLSTWRTLPSASTTS
jgi:hypothetical protein